MRKIFVLVKRMISIGKNLGIQAKLLISFALLIIVPLYLLGVKIYQQSAEIIRAESRSHLEFTAYQTANNIDLLLEKVVSLTFAIQTDSDIQDLLVNINTEENPDDLTRRRYSDALKNELLKHSYEKDVEYVGLVANSGFEVSLYSYGAVEDTPKIDITQIKKGNGSVIWLGYNEPSDTIFLGAEINSIRTQKPLGYIILSVGQRAFERMFSQMEYSGESDQFLVDERNRFISYNKDFGEGEIPSSLLYGLDHSRYWGFFDDEAAGKYAVYHRLQNAPWYFVLRVGTEVIERPLATLRSSIVLLELIIITAALLLALLFTRTISNPIRKLMAAMKKFSEGDMDIRCDVQSTNEIGQINRRFNEMVENINILLDKYEKEIVLKHHSELKALRMQINPHFLYNTLETINWMARINQMPEIGIVTKSLGNLMRTTISGPPFVPLEKELASLMDYWSIQKYRCGDRIDLSVAIPESMYQLYVPKLIIQPIVENAIVHGLKEKASDGRIDVYGEITSGKACIYIKDNGKGISAQKLSTLFKEKDETSDDHAHIGLSNVDTRLKMDFGENFGLLITSMEGKGTQVVIVIPTATSPEEQNM